MAWFSFFLYVLFLPVVIVIVKESSNILTNDPKTRKSGEKSAILDTISSIVDKTQEDVDELRCPEKWSQLGYSCYLLSDYVSTVRQANHTCDLLHWNNSRLMFIQQPVQLSYAAYVLTKNNLNNLLIEVDQDLMKGGKIVNMLSSNDDIQWQEFGKKILQHRLKDSKEKVQSARKHRSHHDNTIEREPIIIAKDGMDNDNKDHNNFENIDHIRNPCQKIKWNVVNEDSNVLILTVELDSHQSICSLSNIDFRAAYSHLCQYMLDRCFNNIICGKHGRCINTQTGFNCSCSFLYDGLFCEKLSHKDIQIIIAIIIIVISILVTFTRPRNFLLCIVKWAINHDDQQPEVPPAPAPPQPANNENDYTRPARDEPRIQHPTTDQAPPELNLTTKEPCHRKIFLGVLTIIFLLFFFKFPAISDVKLIQMNGTNSSEIKSFINDSVHMIKQYTRYTILRIDNLIFFLTSAILVAIFSFLNKPEPGNQDDDDDRSGLVEPIKLLRITDRYETTIIIAIQMFEILKILEGTLIDIDESVQYGVLFVIFKRIFFVILIGLRYYPILASLQFQHFSVRLLTVVYFVGSMVYMTIHGSSGTHWLPFSMKIFLSKENNLHIDLRSWSFVYGTARNILDYLLIGYISAELTMRLGYDSIYIILKRGKNIGDILPRKIEQYSFPKEYMKKCCSENATTVKVKIPKNDHLNQQGYWFRIRKYIIDHFREYANKIYEWEDDFRYTTIAICTYTVAFIFLFYLTGTVILLYTTETKGYLLYTKSMFEHILNIEVKERSFQSRVAPSAIITMIIYAIQLFLSMKNYRKKMRELYIDTSKDIKSKKPKKPEIIRRSTQYPSYLLLYLLGGFFICFHLILFIVTLFTVVQTHTGSFKQSIGYIASPLILYLLQKMIIQWLHMLFATYNWRDTDDLKINKFDSILLYVKFISSSFIGIISSIIRLIICVLVNIIFMPRIDCSYLVEPLQTLDTAHMAFLSFLRLEILCTYPILLEFSSTVKQATSQDIPVIENITTAVEHAEYLDAETNEVRQPEPHRMVEMSQNNRDTRTSTFQPPSQLSSRRSSIHVDEPMVSNIRSNADQEVTARLLPNEVLDSQV